MTNKFTLKLWMTALLSATLLLNSSCNKDEDDNPVDAESKYSLGIVVGSVNYVLACNDLDAGSVSPVGNGVELGGAEFIQSGDHFYFFTRADKKFHQYALNADGSVTESASLLLTGYITDRAYSQNLVDASTILIMDPIQWGEPEIKWLLISIPDFVITASGTFTLPTFEKTAGVNWNVNLGRGALHGSKFIMGTVYYDFDGNYADGTHAIVLDYPSMTNPTMIETQLTTAELGIFTNNSFVKADNGDLYIAGYRGFYGVPSNDNVKGVVFRIKNGETDFDESYLLDFTATLGESTQIMQLDYTGSGKAIGMLFIDTDVVDWDDLDNDHYYFATIDLATKAVSKLSVPKSSCRLARKPLVHDGKYITFHKSVANSTTHVLTINLSDGSFTKGAQVEGTDVDGYSVVKHPAE